MRRYSGCLPVNQLAVYAAAHPCMSTVVKLKYHHAHDPPRNQSSLDMPIRSVQASIHTTVPYTSQQPLRSTPAYHHAHWNLKAARTKDDMIVLLCSTDPRFPECE
ncbi:hypothetical protein BDW22DRAFT_770118 [Trametopsis cervina]|nr:hypothetical protein BDW22DRAFT_770118 [Trametopsis cervina]